MTNGQDSLDDCQRHLGRSEDRKEFSRQAVPMRSLCVMGDRQLEGGYTVGKQVTQGCSQEYAYILRFSFDLLTELIDTEGHAGVRQSAMEKVLAPRVVSPP